MQQLNKAMATTTWTHMNEVEPVFIFCFKKMKTIEVANKQKLTNHLMQHVWMKYGNKKRASFNTWIMHSQQLSKPNATDIDNTLNRA